MYVIVALKNVPWNWGSLTTPFICIRCLLEHSKVIILFNLHNSMGRHQDHPFWNLRKPSLRELTNLPTATQIFNGKARHWTKVCVVLVHVNQSVMGLGVSIRRLPAWGGLRAGTYRDNAVHAEAGRMAMTLRPPQISDWCHSQGPRTL